MLEGAEFFAVMIRPRLLGKAIHFVFIKQTDHLTEDRLSEKSITFAHS
jgi:hypothetical protein